MCSSKTGVTQRPPRSRADDKDSASACEKYSFGRPGDPKPRSSSRRSASRTSSNDGQTETHRGTSVGTRVRRTTKDAETVDTQSRPVSARGKPPAGPPGSALRTPRGSSTDRSLRTPRENVTALRPRSERSDASSRSQSPSLALQPAISDNPPNMVRGPSPAEVEQLLFDSRALLGRADRYLSKSTLHTRSGTPDHAVKESNAGRISAGYVAADSAPLLALPAPQVSMVSEDVGGSDFEYSGGTFLT